jgi:hypothetical protein
MQSSQERKMRDSRSRAVCTAIAACAAVVALPAAAADAKKKPSDGVKQAVFKATLKGSQVTTWEYHHKKDKDDGCDIDTDAYGDQTIKFDGKRTFRITFNRPPKSKPDLFGTDGRPAVAITTPLRVKATADRHSDFKFGAVNHVTCPGDNGGADPGSEPPKNDCGRRVGSFAAKLYYHDNSEDADLFVPLPGTHEKNNLRLDGWDYMWQKPGAAPHDELRNTYENCEFLGDIGTTDDLGHIYLSPAKLNEKQLFDKKRKRFVVSGDHIGKIGGGESSGQVILAWNLHLTRVK